VTGALLSLLAPLWMTGSALVVLGEGQDGCPRAAQVEARLGALLPDEPGGDPPDALVFDGGAGALRVRLLSAAGAVREQKTLELRGSCDELADAVATLAVAWRSRLRSDDVPAPVLPPPPLAVAAAPDPVPAPDPLPPAGLEVAAGLETAAGIHRWTPGLVASLQTPVGRRVSFASGLSVRWPSSAPDQTGKNFTWLQASLMVAPSFRVIGSNLLVDTHLGLAAGIDLTTSEALDAAGSYALVPPSVVLGVRWIYTRVTGRPWFAINGSLALAGQASPIRGAALPGEPFTLGLALGASFELERNR
jgi:hypothetical protein